MNKFLLLTLLACFVSVAKAAVPETIFSFTVTSNESVKYDGSTAIDFSTYTNITGGTVAVCTGSEILNKGTLIMYKNTILKVVLAEGNVLHPGDVISFSALADSAEDTAYDINIFPTEKRAADIATKNEYTVTDEDEIHGLSTFYFSGSSSKAAKVQSITVSRTNTTTDIEDIVAPSAVSVPVKYIKDGKVVIARDGKEYDVLGRRIK